MERRVSLFAKLSLVFTLIFPVSAWATVIYTYTGQNFDEVFGTAGYATSMNVAGSFTRSSLLPSDTPLTDYSASISSYSFQDGVNPFTEANSAIDYFGLQTDLLGNIVEWEISVSTLSLVSGVGKTVLVIETSNSPSSGSPRKIDGGSVGTCVSWDSTTGCYEYNWDSQGDGSGLLRGDSYEPGSWTSSAVPEPTTLTLMGLGLAGIGYRRKRKLAS